MNLLKVLLVLSYLLGTACAIKKAEKEDGNKPRIEVKAEAEGPIVVQVHPLPIPNLYQLELKIPTELEKLQVMFNGKHWLKDKLERRTLELSGGTAYKIEFLENLDGQWQVANIQIDQLQGRIPKDVVFAGNQSLSGPLSLKVGRAFFYEDFHLLTQGYSFEIEATEVIGLTEGSRRAVIESFEDGKVAYQSAGRSGGLISLKAEKAIGNMSIFLRGENGAHGLDGEPFSTPAKPGVDAKPPVNQDARALLCFSGTGQGGTGEKGENGRNGQSGFNGGDAGTIKLAIKDVSEFGLNLSSQPGLGGLGGRGGEGQLGGVGGVGAAHRGCPFSGKPGKSGANGTRGQDGVLGSSGKDVVIQNQNIK